VETGRAYRVLPQAGLVANEVLGSSSEVCQVLSGDYRGGKAGKTQSFFYGVSERQNTGVKR
jgi:hypothetical protein